MTAIEDYNLVGRIQEMFDDEFALKRFLSDIPSRHLDKILVKNGFSVVRARSKYKTFVKTCSTKSRITPQLARMLSDAQEAGAFRHFKAGGRYAVIKGGPFKIPGRKAFERSLNRIASQSEYFKSLHRKLVFTVPRLQDNTASIVLAYVNEPRPFETWIYEIQILETVSRARYAIDLDSGRISTRGRYETLVNEGLKTISQALTGDSMSFEFMRFDEKQIRKVVENSNEAILELVLETKKSLGFIDRIVIRGSDVEKGLKLLKDQGIDLESFGILSGAETVSYRIMSEGEFSDRRGDQSVLADFQ